MKKHFFVLAAIIIGSQLRAQDSTAKVLEEAVVQSNSGKVVTIISKQQLERSGGKSLNEILNTAVGTNIIGANNAMGTNQTVSIRGASAGNVLILIDGIPVNDPSVITNYFDINFLNIDQVERIEILKGGQSTLFGSDAVAGAINIITKKGGNGKFSVNGKFSAGSHHTLKEYVGFGKQQSKTEYAVNYSHISTDGISAAYDKLHTGKFDHDKFDEHVVNGRFGFKAGKKIKMTLSGQYSFYDADLDAAAFTDEKDYTVENDNKQARATVEYKYRNGSINFNYHFNRVERNYLDDSGYKSSPYVDYSKADYIGRTHFAEVYGYWNSGPWQLLAGFDYRFNNTEQEYFSTGPFGPYAPPALNAEMNQLSPYVSVLHKNENGFNVEAGTRWNKHSIYGSNITFSLNPFYMSKNKYKIFGNLYSAFKTPTLYQLFDPSAVGNPDLKPEKSLVADAGIEIFSVKNLQGRIAAFYRDAKDVILYTYNPMTFSSTYKNASKQTNYGAELELNYSVKKVILSGNYTYTTGKTTAAFDGTGSPIGKDTTYYNLYRIPKHAFNINLGVQQAKSIFYSIAIRSVSKREEFIFGSAPEKLNAYFTIDLYGEYKFDKGVKLFLDLKNIAGKEYFDILGYNSKKFNFTGGVSFQL